MRTGAGPWPSPVHPSLNLADLALTDAVYVGWRVIIICDWLHRVLLCVLKLLWCDGWTILVRISAWISNVWRDLAISMQSNDWSRLSSPTKDIGSMNLHCGCSSLVSVDLAVGYLVDHIIGFLFSFNVDLWFIHIFKVFLWMVLKLCLVCSYPCTNLFSKRRGLNYLWLQLWMLYLVCLLISHCLAYAPLPVVLSMSLADPFLLLDLVDDSRVVPRLITSLRVHTVRSFKVRGVSDLAGCLWWPSALVYDVAVWPWVVLILKQRLLDLFLAGPLLGWFILTFWYSLLNVLWIRWVEGGELLELSNLLDRDSTLAVVRNLHDIEFDVT